MSADDAIADAGVAQHHRRVREASCSAVHQSRHGTVMDGELVVLDGDDYPDFAALMRGEGATCLLAFDLLALGGWDLCDAPIEDRKRCLDDLMSGLSGHTVQNTDGIVGEGRALLDLVTSRGMEGMLAKRLGSRYAPRQRTGAWIKIKVPGNAPERWTELFDRGGGRQRELADA